MNENNFTAKQKGILICLICAILTIIAFVIVFSFIQNQKAIRISNANQKVASLISDIYAMDPMDKDKANIKLSESKDLILKNSLTGSSVEKYYEAKNYVENASISVDEALAIVAHEAPKQLPGSGYDRIYSPTKESENDTNYLIGIALGESNGGGAVYYYKVNKKTGVATFIDSSCNTWEILDGCKEFIK